MMEHFEVGEKLVCVDPGEHFEPFRPYNGQLVKGQVYTSAGMNGTLVYIEEMSTLYFARRFQRVKEKPEKLSPFQAWERNSLDKSVAVC